MTDGELDGQAGHGTNGLNSDGSSSYRTLRRIRAKNLGINDGVVEREGHEDDYMNWSDARAAEWDKNGESQTGCYY